LRSLGGANDTLKEQLVTDYKTADITDDDKLILEFVELVNNDAPSVTKEYIDNLKKHGFSEEKIHDIVQVTSYFNYVNRLADGLGVELETK